MSAISQGNLKKVSIDIITKIRERLDFEEICRTAVKEIGRFFKADRVFVYRFDPSTDYRNGTVVAEAVVPEFKASLGFKFCHCYWDKLELPNPNRASIHVMSDLNTAKLSDCYINFLKQFQVQTNLTLPLWQGNYIWGCLSIHQCGAPRQWQDTEIASAQCLAAHLATAIEHAEQMALLKRQLLESQQVQQKLLESERQYRQILDSIADMVLVKGPQSKIIWGNKAFRDYYGMTNQELQNLIDAPFNNVDYTLQYVKDDAYVFETGNVLEIPEEPVTRWDGEVRLFSTVKSPIRDQNDCIVMTVGVSRDFTERKAAEVGLAQSEAKYRRLVENAYDIIFEHCLDGVFTYVSPKVIDILGYGPDELLGASWVSFIHPDDLSVTQRFLQLILETGEKQAGLELRAKRKNGSWCPIAVNISPTKDPGGNIVSFLGIARDISDRKHVEEVLRDSEAQLRQQAVELEEAINKLKRTQAQLIQSEKMSSLGQLVAGVAHEINNPVNFIYGNLSHASDYSNQLIEVLKLYQKYYPDSCLEIQDALELMDLDFLFEDLPKLLSSMKVGSERIRQIVASLRTFSRMDEAEKKNVDIHEGIDSTLMILQHRFKAKAGRYPIKIAKEYGQLPLVECYPGPLNQVFMNIISNALDALEERDAKRSDAEIIQVPSCIRIVTEQTGTNAIVVRIIDNGPGISESICQRLFDPFFTTKPVGKGTGMGLSISYQIVTEKHGGSLECSSVMGQGAEFAIEIPIQLR